MSRLTADSQWLKPFYINFECSYVYGDILSVEADATPHLLCLPGKDHTGKQGFSALRHFLHEQYALTSCAFDFLAHEDSPLVTSLYREQQALNQTSDIIHACFDSQPLSIIAADHSARIALQIAQRFWIKHLILLNPPLTLHVPHTVHCHSILLPVATTQTFYYLNQQPILLNYVGTLIGNCLHANVTPLHYAYQE